VTVAKNLHQGPAVQGPSYEIANCAVCGHSNARVVAEQDDMRAEVESLWDFHERRLRPRTPADRLMDRVAFSEHPPLRLVQCNECGLIYRNPVERGHELTQIYAREAPAPPVLESLHRTQVPALRAQAAELRRQLHGGGSVLEVGSYVGAFLAAAREHGLSAEGIDINPCVNVFTRSLGFTVHDGELESFDPDRRFAAVAIWNTFDQLAEPRRTVNAAFRLLARGGVLAIRVPNGAFYARLRRATGSRNRIRRAIARGLLAQNNLLTFPYRWGFTPGALAALLREVGFAVTRIRGDVLVPIADEWTRPWARVEESLIKRGLGAAASARLDWAPWFEVYARRD
jgi:SAM-dependent methyltransferase